MKKIFLSLIIVGMTMVSFAKNEGNKTEADNSATVAPAIATIQLSGVVTDKTSNEALVGVEVKIEGTNEKVYTDFDGKFTFRNLKPGEYNLVASYISYEKNVVEHVNVGTDNQVAISLESSN
ncbi:MAG TPA: carboxypeptidase-like regulatory domain-containing protein [Prolixibacteraceae bacterium]|nr:carboxypeptidase-like regulatory domain-containing protein [Prolixibacteraceae bacterium]